MKSIGLFSKVFALMLLTLAAISGYAQDKQGDYRLGPGDAIRIQVFQNPDLTLESRVSEGGTITFPLVGTVTIGGITLSEAEQAIAKALKDGGFVQQPQVNIVLLQVRGNQVSVLGEVNRPGRFPLETFNTHASDILALAGGITPLGSQTIILTGIRDGKPYRKEIDTAGMFLDKSGESDIAVVGGDKIYVPRAPMFYIYGEAQRPGSYRIERGMTVRQALAMGGGPTPRGTEYFLRIDRKKPDGTVERISPSKDDLVQPEDVIYIRESIF